MMSSLYGAATMLIAMGAFVVRSQQSDSGWMYSADGGTIAIGLSGYALLFLGARALRRATRAAQASSTRT
jgi:hypothetical protein